MDQTLIMDQVSTGGQKERIRKLRRRLQTSDTFVMPEVWDVASARIMADAGFEFIGMSATALGWSLGYSKDDRIAADDILTMAERITDGFDVPVNVDLEGAAGRSLEELRYAVGAAISTGCVGITLSDGGRNGAHGIISIDEMAECVRAMKAATVEAKMPAVITISTEAFLLGPKVHSPFETTVERSEAYFAAGADCVLVPGVQHIQILEKLTGVVDGPLAISVAYSPAPNLKSFADIGISCITLGSGLFRSLLGNMRYKAEELIAFGQFNQFDKAVTEDQLEELIAGTETRS
ncbi:MAG TPA: isocitrate lyase/phosphoenolpyruvate mutase family protein [Hyphomicrobiales bacterium]|nr:isocitrate lyase/phosphoenolpyruvate mutase family protein [Hyphomicrobiales bacterium]